MNETNSQKLFKLLERLIEAIEDENLNEALSFITDEIKSLRIAVEDLKL